MNISLERMKHSLAVARKMKILVELEPIKYGINPEEAFLLGFIHDIGYEFCNTQYEHAKIGGNILHSQGYKHWKEVYYHGIIQYEYNSSLLQLLNFVDMTTGPNGEDMTMEERIDDIIKRYGKESPQAKEAKELVDYIYSLKEQN
ncbi:hypothetical protein LC567_10345 [Fusobacterium animalis]|uniref:HD domain-containing protein n=1 Tax=Fusobacterium animalis TaxID=76859 RepID=UPI0030CC3009